MTSTSTACGIDCAQAVHVFAGRLRRSFIALEPLRRTPVGGPQLGCRSIAGRQLTTVPLPIPRDEIRLVGSRNAAESVSPVCAAVGDAARATQVLADAIRHVLRRVADIDRVLSVVRDLVDPGHRVPAAGRGQLVDTPPSGCDGHLETLSPRIRARVGTPDRRASRSARRPRGQGRSGATGIPRAACGPCGRSP